jgi:hypothetical protein
MFREDNAFGGRSCWDNEWPVGATKWRRGQGRRRSFNDSMLA